MDADEQQQEDIQVLDAVSSSDNDDGQVFRGHDVLQNGLRDLKSTGHFCDVTLIAREQRFQAHRVVLAAVSPYFLSMFTSDMLEAQQTEIRLHGIEPATLKELIEFAYTSKVRVTNSNVQNLLAGARLLQISYIVEACSEYMQSRLEVSNVVDVLQIAITFGCSALEEAAEKFILKNFTAVAQTEEFLSLPHPLVARILSHNDLSIPSEEDVFKAAVAWVNTDVETRKELMASLLSLVRLPLLGIEYLTNTVASEELVRNSVGCQELLNKAIDYRKNPGKRRFLQQTFIVRPRCCYDDPGFIVAVGGSRLLAPADDLNSVEVYDTIVGQWAPLEVPDEGKSLHPKRWEFGAAVVHGSLYAIGGESDQGEPSAEASMLELFSPVEAKWSQIRQLCCHRSECEAVVCAGKLYMCGGRDENNETSQLPSVEYYNPETGRWVLLNQTQQSQMVTPRSGAGVAALDNKIFDGAHINFLDSVECFDTETEQWAQLKSMSTRRSAVGAAVLNGKIYACGGHSGEEDLASVECYDPLTDHWTMVASMNTRRCVLSVVANCGKLYAIGGSEEDTMHSSMEIYSPEENVWRLGPSMMSHKGPVGVGLVPMNTDH